MKTIGLIGGMSWESSTEYYKIINSTINKRLGGLHSAKILMYSFDFAEIEELQHKNKWDEAINLMVDAAKRLEKANADFILICTNTMHKMAEDITKNINIPLLHIADVTAEEAKSKNIRKIGLLGTKFTMEQDFYKDRLKKHNIETLIPTDSQREVVHNIIYKELCLGEIRDSSRESIKDIIYSLSDNGAQGIVLGCTELPLLIKQDDSNIPLFDTTVIHAKAAVDFSLKD